ncbi:MAG TPA: histone deacetylase [Nanoarchaeota archaeon]|nr:histone deacetylase [Nanoarchaeota archaeon]
MKVVFDEKCLNYIFPFHPENPQRVEKIKLVLEELGASFIKPRKINETLLLKVHEKEFIKKLKNKEYFDLDTPKLDFDYILSSVSCAVKAAKVNGFSLSRPPGHHAGKNFLGGFCYLNNIAVALKSIQKKEEKAVILDIDAHHGNGTENIFFGKENVLYISLHQYPLFPGTGKESRKNCINFALPPYTKGEFYIKVLIKALKIVEKFSPDIFAISLGFDTYEKDNLSQLLLKEKDFEKIALLVKPFKQTAKKFFMVLEGGYAKDIEKPAKAFFEKLLE